LQTWSCWHGDRWRFNSVVHEVPHDDAACFHRAADRTMMMTSQTVTDGVDVPSSHDHCVGNFTSTPHVPSTAASSPFRISNS